MTAWDRLSTLQRGFLASAALHAAVWLFFSVNQKAADWLDSRSDPLEIDLTRPFRLALRPDLQFRAKNSGTGAAPVKIPDPTKAPTPGGGVKNPDWIQSAPGAKPVLAPPADDVMSGAAKSTAPATGLGGLGIGEGDGEVDWVYLTELPRLLNREEIARNIRRFYPEEERRRGQEGQVVVNLHIDRSGRAIGLDVLDATAPDFEGAARQVLAAARFSPAKVGTRPVPVKIRQTIAFHLED